MSEFVPNFGSVYHIADDLSVPNTETAYSSAFPIDDGFSFSVQLWSQGQAVDVQIVKQYSFSTAHSMEDATWMDTESDGTEDVFLANYTQNGVYTIDSIQPKYAIWMRLKFVGNDGNGHDTRIRAWIAKQRKANV